MAGGELSLRAETTQVNTTIVFPPLQVCPSFSLAPFFLFFALGCSIFRTSGIWVRKVKGIGYVWLLRLGMGWRLGMGLLGN